MNSTELKILTAAHQLFFRFGFKKTSVDEIAAEAGVGKGTIYNHYSNKEELFMKLGESMQTLVKEQVEREISHVTQADERIFERIDREMKLFSAKKLESGATPAIMQELFEVCGHLKSLQKYNEIGLIRDLELGVEQGIFKKIDVEQTFKSIYTVMGQFMLKWLFMDYEEVKLERNSILKMMIDGIRV
ncbi:MAG: helix-turn-helix domain-containing protein [SAR324 cluster bacterium]|nr:helix-turn-helix domain-containing protein [SAR324 cluster bacterium]